MAFKVIAQFRPGYPQTSSAVQAPMWVDITERIDFQSLQWDQQATDKNTSLRFDIFTFLPLSTTRYDEYASWAGESAPIDPEDVDPRLGDAIHDTSFFIDLTNRAEVKLLDGENVLWGGVIGSVDTERVGASHVVQRVEAYDFTALLDELVVRDYNAPNVSESLNELATETGLTSQVVAGGSALIAGAYTFRVIAVDGDGDPLTIFTHITQYITPSDVNPADITDTPLRTIQLDWTEVAGVDEYLVYAKQGIGTTGLYLQATIAAGTETYSLSTTPVSNTTTSPEQYVQKGSIDVDIISGSSDPENGNYKGIFNAIDPALDPGINNTTYVKPAKVLAGGEPDPENSYRFSPVLETGVVLTSPFGGKTLKQALKTISDKTGAIFWVDAEKNLHYANKKAQELVENPRFDSSSTKWTLGTNHTIQPSRGPFGFGNALIASTSSSTNETKSDPIDVTANSVYMARVRGWANANFASDWDCELRYYSDAAGLTQVGTSQKLHRTVSFDGTDEQRWCKTWVIATAHSTAVTARLVAKRKSGASGACGWTDFSLIEITGSYGFSDRPSENEYAIPMRGFETPKAPREASGIANRLLVYGVYKDPTNTNELESVEYNAGLSLTKALGGSLTANTYWVRVIAETPDGDVYVKYAKETITDADVAAPSPVRTLSANWAAVPTATQYRIYVGSGRMAMRLKATQAGTSLSISSPAAGGAGLSGEPDIYYYKTFDFAPGLWESGGKVVEASLNDQLVDSEVKAETRALSFWEEKGIAMRTWEFDHLEEAPEVGTVIPFIWEADDIAEPLVVKGTKGKFLGDRIFWTTTLGSDPSLIKKGVTQIFADIKQASLRLNDVLPPTRPTNLALTAPSASLIQTVDGVTRSTVIAQWDPSAEDDFSNYVVQYGYDANFANAQVINVAQTPTVRSTSTGQVANVVHSFQAEPGKRLYFRVAAQDRTGNRSDFTDSAVDLPSDTTPPDAPTGVTVTASLKSMAIAWGFGFYDPAIPDQNTNNTDFNRFKVYRKQYNAGTTPNEPWVKIAETSTNVYIDTSFPNYTNLYQYKVSTVDRTGNESTATQETTPTWRSPNKITGTVDIEDATITSAQISSLTANLITAGTLNISTGMSVISDGTATLPQFEVDKDGVTIRDDAGNVVLEVNGSTANLNADFLNVTGIEATEITVGSGGSVVRVGNYPDSITPTFQGIWGGAANPTSAAFTLATSGAVTASNLTATGGSIGGWTVGAATISSSSGNVVLNNNGIITAGSSSPSQAHMSGDGFWAGASSSNFATAPFRVSTSGGVTAKNISVVGGTVSVGDAPVAISYLARSASGIVTIKTATAVNATVGQNITIDVTSAPWATDADFNGAFNVLSITASAPYTITYQGATLSAVAEVAATGFVYTGARISGESASGTWFTVGTGFALKNPANVGQDIITATASNVSINADFINAGSVSLGNLGANAIQSTNFSVSNTGTITAQDGTVGGWTLASTKLSSGTSTSYVALATSGGYSIYAGSETASLAPFSVTPQGALTAKSGAIGGFTLASDRLTNLGASKYAGIIDTALDTGLAFFAGATNTSGSSATFAVTNAGAVTASDITATGGTVGGWTLASSRLFSSATSGATTKFYGVVADPVLLGRAFFAGATNSAGDSAVFEVLNDGSVVANNLSITGGPAAGNVISVNSGTFSVTSAGAMTATSASVTGTISTSNITATGGFIGGWTLNSTSLTNSGGASGQYAGILDTPSTGIAFFAGATDSVGASAKFSVTNDGAITATSGTIGGYTLASDRLTNLSTGASPRYAGLIDTTADTGLAFFAGATSSAGASATFSVTNAGVVSASDLAVTGGSVGGWKIESDRLYNALASSPWFSGLYRTSTSDGLAFFAGATTSTGTSAAFFVENDGSMTATNVTVIGTDTTLNTTNTGKLTLQPSASQGGALILTDGTLVKSAGYSATRNTTTGNVVVAYDGTDILVGMFITTATTPANFYVTNAKVIAVTPGAGGNFTYQMPTGTTASGTITSFTAYKSLQFLGGGLTRFQQTTGDAGAVASGSLILGNNSGLNNIGTANLVIPADGELVFNSTATPKYTGGGNLYQSATNVLRTSGSFAVGSELTVSGGASITGDIAGADIIANGGGLYVDATTVGGYSALYFRSSANSALANFAVASSGVITANTGTSVDRAADIQADLFYPGSQTTYRMDYNNGSDGLGAGGIRFNTSVVLTAGSYKQTATPTTYAGLSATWYPAQAAGDSLTITRASSSRRYKTNITDIDQHVLDAVKRLRPVHYSGMHGQEIYGRRLGFIVEEMEEAGLDCVVLKENGLAEGYDQMGVVSALLGWVRELEARISELESR